MANSFVHMELMSTDTTESKAFYGKLFDWKFEDMQMPDMTYTMIKPGADPGGGMLKNPIPNSPSMWIPYVLVDDAKAAGEKAKSLGGSVMKDYTEVPDMGGFVIITDPTGAMLGLWQAKM